MRTRAPFAATLLAVTACIGGCATPADHPAADAHGSAPSGLTADQALARLLEGNRRFVEGHRAAAAGDVRRRAEVAGGQHPIAIVVCCADSRVGPEIVFDQGLGDVFVVRAAGQVLDDAGLGSVEYAVDHLHAPLIVVVGHEKCGAVAAAVAGGAAPGHIGALVGAIRPAVEQCKGRPGDAVDNAVRQNVVNQVKQLRAQEPIVSEFVHGGRVKVIGARYDLDTGVIELLPD